jgi:ribosome small subunit-dependent GTPase A
LARNDWSKLDESDVRVRPGKGTRPRSKRRPEHADAVTAMVIGKDRGRWTCAIDADPGQVITTMRAREMGRTPVVVGDRVGVVGDVSGKPDTLARIIRVDERSSSLLRTADDTDPYERLVVANAERLLIVTALADPPPRTGFIDRCLVACYAGGVQPVLCLTKADLASPDELLAGYAGLDIPAIVTRYDEEPEGLAEMLKDRVTALVGHSGVGKSTLVNRLVRRRGEWGRQGAAHVRRGGGPAAPGRRMGDRHAGCAVVRPGPRHRGPHRRRLRGVRRSRRGVPVGLRAPRPARGPGLRARRRRHGGQGEPRTAGVAAAAAGLPRRPRGDSRHGRVRQPGTRAGSSPSEE